MTFFQVHIFFASELVLCSLEREKLIKKVSYWFEELRILLTQFQPYFIKQLKNHLDIAIICESYLIMKGIESFKSSFLGFTLNMWSFQCMSSQGALNNI